ncbi:DUF599 domain-containing protein [Roseovarius sp. MBR-6]|jgi:uncharacterized membrane protein|uniref:DUF599 domain-containing protein n=1 Tax=Roseovarius sp. MBR-6 TaxID=3156459 RepID=UPI00339559D6
MEVLAQALGHFTTLDLWAVAALITGWACVTLLIEHAPARFPSTSNLMARYRREWMVQFVARDPRIFDSQVIGQLRQGTSFFASATLIAIGGALALLGDVERLIGIADDLTAGTDPVIVWEVKILTIIIFLTNAFLKFVWANRLFGYCAVVMAAVPNDPADPAALPRAHKAGAINITAARGFNRGLRALYFALAAAAWLLGPWPLLLAVALTLGVLLRREFASESRAVLMRPDK